MNLSDARYRLAHDFYLQQTGTTALFFAAQGGFLDITKILLKAGGIVDCPSVDGGTALFVACQGGHASIVKELLNAGANVNAFMKVNFN